MDAIEEILTEQIAALDATAGVFVQQRSDHLSAAQAAQVSEAGARARADTLRASLDAYRALIAPPEVTP